MSYLLYCIKGPFVGQEIPLMAGADEATTEGGEESLESDTAKEPAPQQ